MITVKREGILLEPTSHTFENESVMNPAVIAEGKNIHLLYRAVQPGNHSSIGYCLLQGPMHILHRNQQPLLYPQHDYEHQGIEDPRIVKIEDLYYLTYTAYDGMNAVGALATSPDLKNFRKKGIITSGFTYHKFKSLIKTEGPHIGKYFRSGNKRESTTMSGKPLYITDKNIVLFPRKINDKFLMLHRIKPDIQWATFCEWEELTPAYWKNYYKDFTRHILLEPKHPHESSYIGAGCPPIETKEGWLMIYHSVYDTPAGYVYNACAALLDPDDPTREIARLPYPLFSPEESYETHGIVNRVCFPTGALIIDDLLYIYYGAADRCIACASIPVNELIQELLKYKK